MKRIIAVLITAVLLVGLLSTGAVFAKQPNGHHESFDVEGYFIDIESVPISTSMPRPGFLAINWTQKTEMHGTFDGICNTTFVMTINLSNYSFVSEGDTIFTGRVNGLPGESTHHFIVNGHFNGPPDFGAVPPVISLEFSGPANVTSGKGALSHLRGFYTLDAGINAPQSPYFWFTYSGTMEYDPHLD